MADNYLTQGEEFGNSYVNIESQDWFPIHNQWRGQPTSDKPFIRANVAGVYPYPKTKRRTVVRPEPRWEYNWNYGSTAFPSNPQFGTTREIILER
jgi:hypothetical protein